jgi:hypothetical protein
MAYVAADYICFENIYNIVELSPKVNGRELGSN